MRTERPPCPFHTTPQPVCGWCHNLEPILAFDRMILAAYLATPAQPARAQAICVAAGLKLTAANLARVLNSLQLLEAHARRLQASTVHP